MNIETALEIDAYSTWSPLAYISFVQEASIVLLLTTHLIVFPI
jgi:hypothetical protein